MDYPLTSRKISKTLDLLQSNSQNPSKLKDHINDLPILLLFYLSSPVRVEDTNKLFNCLDNYLKQNPIRFLIPLSGYFSHGLIKDKPKILSLFKTHYFANTDILKPTVFVLVLSTLRAIADSNEISAPAIEMLDNASRSYRIHECTWEIVLNSPKARSVGLGYLTYRLVVDNKLRALHALLACLEDPSLAIKKSAFGLIKRIFPFDSKDVTKDIKIIILARVLELFVNDRSLATRVLEWVQSSHRESLEDDGIDIVVESVLKVSKAFKQDEIMSIHNNFLMDLVESEKIIRKILVPLAINYCKNEGNLPEFFENLLLRNSQLFWFEYNEMFLKSFSDQSCQSELFELADQLLTLQRDSSIIESLVRTLLQHSDENPELYLKFAMQLLEYLKKTSISLTELEEFGYKSRGDWKTIVTILIRFYHLSVDCELLIGDICEENSESDEDRIYCLLFLLKYNPDKLKKEDIEFVFVYSLKTEKTELLSLIIQLIPRKISKELKILVCFDSEFGLECLIFANALGLKYSASLLIEIGKTFIDDDYNVIFFAVKWLNQIIIEKIDIFSPLLKYFEIASRKYEEKAKKILESLKLIIKTGGWPVLKSMVHFTEQKILTKLEQFILRPPHNSSSFRILACELGSEIIINSTSEFSAALVDVGLEILVKAIMHDENWLLIVLVDFFDNLLLSLAGEAEYNYTSRGLVNILDPLTRLIAYPNTLVRNAWLDFIKRLAPFMLKYLDSGTLLNYFNNILRTYFTILSDSNDFKILVALETLTLQLLQFNDEEDPNLLKTIKKLLIFSLQKYLNLSLSKNIDQSSVAKKILHEIFEACPAKCIKKIVAIWVEDCLYSAETWFALHKYIEIIAELGLDLYEVFKKIRLKLEENFEPNQENNEKILTISCVLCKFQEKVSTRRNEIWNEAIFIYEKIFSVDFPEICFFVSYSLILLRQQVTWTGLGKNELIILSNLVKKCIEMCLESSSSSLLPHKLPYPLVSSSPVLQLSELYLSLINTCFYQIVDIGAFK